MTTENAVEKMRELMASVDSINRFSNVRKTLPLLVIITLVSVLSSFVIVALIDVYDFLTVSFPGNIMISNVSIGGVADRGHSVDCRNCIRLYRYEARVQ